ncbi:MAG: SMP-30/gluconolactonase/LRE family protein [Phycisphaerae bacterium]|nr:SMP-30/gluconolactonase/LRE family protein [Phycisphaerae bacterium]
MERMKTARLPLCLAAVLAAAAAVTLSGCGMPAAPHQPTIAVNLTERYNTPDGMVLDANGDILLNVPNFNNPDYPAVLVKIDKNNRLTELFAFPPHPETGRACPLGIDVGPDGNYYVADNQSFVTPGHKSRLLRLNVKNGQVVGCDILVTGFMQANAVSCHGDSVYVTETSLDTEASPMPSGVYRFRYAEFTGEPIVLEKGGADKHLLVKFFTDNEDWRVGANGMGFDADGNLYVCNFGEASLLKFTFGEDGNIASHEVVAKGQGMESTDGLKIHPVTGEIFIADFVANAVHKVDPKTGAVTTIWRNENNSGGIGGLLDRPSEVCIRGNKVYVANIDLPMAGNEFDAPHTISVITLE